MAYQALYRKWRPQRFGEIVGQQHVTRTLQNALAAGRISHAYLFCGTRGTGKTSTAKVLARAINCTGEVDEKPCNNCVNCLSIIEGRSMDVVEIDAASNRGIDEIRDLREKINFSPSSCKFKVYIIDEVHMLTNEAFNALLKTLEEPPAHVVFVLATTEPHKVPVTILSRCQRFDFRPVGVADMIARMREVAGEGNFKIAEDALHIIARAAGGSLRDALSILDQAASLGEGEITAAGVHRILGTVDEDVLRDMAGYLLGGDAAGAIRTIDLLVAGGKDLRVFARQLGSYLRRMLVDSVSGETHDGDVLTRRRLLLYITKLLVRCEQEMRWSSQPRLLLELFVFEAVEGEGTNTGEDIALRLARVEERLKRLADHRGCPENKIEGKVENKVEGETEKKSVLLASGSGRQHQQGNKSGRSGNNITVDSRKGDQKFVNPPAVSPAASPVNVPLARIKKLWPQVLDAVRKESKATHSYLESAWPAGVSGVVLTLGYEEGDLARDMMEKESNQKTLARVLKSFFKGEWTIRCETGLKPPEAEEKGTGEMDFGSAAEFFNAEEVDKAPPE